MRRLPSHAHASPTVAWTIASIALLGIATSFVGALVRPAGEGRIEALWVLSWVGMPVVGGVIVSRRPGNRVGQLLLGVGVGIGVGLLAESYATVAAIGPDAGSILIGLWWTLDIVGFALAFGLIPLLLLHFPDGRPVGAAAMLLTRATVVLLALAALASITRDEVYVAGGEPFANPLATPVIGSLATAALGPLVTALVGCTVTAAALLVLRHRRSVGSTRLQLRWFAAAATALPVLLVMGNLADAVGETFGDVVFYCGWVLGLNGIAVAIGVAVTRYRLYEIDRLVSRTVTYAVVAALLIVVYVAVAVLPSAMFDLESDLLVAAATLAAAGVFVPLRRHVRARLDRRFNRTRYDADRLVERFGVRVRSELDVEDLLADVRGVVAAAVQPVHVSLWTNGGGRAVEHVTGREARP